MLPNMVQHQKIYLVIIDIANVLFGWLKTIQFTFTASGREECSIEQEKNAPID